MGVWGEVCGALVGWGRCARAWWVHACIVWCSGGDVRSTSALLPRSYLPYSPRSTLMLTALTNPPRQACVPLSVSVSVCSCDVQPPRVAVISHCCVMCHTRTHASTHPPQYGVTALMGAVYQSATECALFLLSHGASFTKRARVRVRVHACVMLVPDATAKNGRGEGRWGRLHAVSVALDTGWLHDAQGPLRWFLGGVSSVVGGCDEHPPLRSCCVCLFACMSAGRVFAPFPHFACDRLGGLWQFGAHKNRCAAHFAVDRGNLELQAAMVCGPVRVTPCCRWTRFPLQSVSCTHTHTHTHHLLCFPASVCLSCGWLSSPSGCT